MFHPGRGGRRNATVLKLASARCSGRAGGGIFRKLDQKPAVHPPPVEEDPSVPCSIFFTAVNWMPQGSHATGMTLEGGMEYYDAKCLCAGGVPWMERGNFISGKRIEWDHVGIGNITY